MKFLFVANFLRDENAGAAGHIVQLAKTLNKNGHLAHNFFRNGLGINSRKNIFLNSIAFLSFPIITTLKIFHLDFINRYDFVIISSGDGFLYALCMKVFLRKKKPMIIMRSHGYEYLYRKELEIEKRFFKHPPFSYKEKIFLFGFRLLQVKIFSYFCDSIFCLNKNEKAYLGSLYPKKKIFAVPVGINPIFMSQKETIKKRDILFVGGWCRMKGRIYLSDILNRLHKDMGELTTSIIGTGLDAKDVSIDFPDAIKNKIRIVKAIPKNMLQQEYATHKVFLFPSLFEGYGNVILEAMASAMVVVISKDLGVSEIIIHGYNGFLIEKRDVEGFVTAIESILKNEALREEIGKNAQKSVSHMTWDNITDTFVEKCKTIRE